MNPGAEARAKKLIETFWTRMWSHIRVEEVASHPEIGPCWLWTRSVNDSGYAQVKKDRKPLMAHRLFYERYVGPIPNGMQACHKCDVPHCLNPSHIFPGSAMDNVKDCIEKGRRSHLIGQAHHNCKLSDDQVKEIRKLYPEFAARWACASLAAKYGICKQSMYHIYCGKRRRFVT